MHDRVAAVAVKIEIEAHCIAVQSSRVGVDRYLDTVGGRGRPLAHRIEGVQYYSRDGCLCLRAHCNGDARKEPDAKANSRCPQTPIRLDHPFTLPAMTPWM